MALGVIAKVLFIKKNWFLDVLLCRLLCIVLIQPHFDYACAAFYPNLTTKLKDILQVTQPNTLALV